MTKSTEKILELFEQLTPEQQLIVFNIVHELVRLNRLVESK